MFGGVGSGGNGGEALEVNEFLGEKEEEEGGGDGGICWREWRRRRGG